MSFSPSLALTCLLLTSTTGLPGQDRGVAGSLAPELRVARWSGLPEGQDSVRLAELRGEVVVLFCFQSWCPGCHSVGFPTLVELTEQYRDSDDVHFFAVQTVFEGQRTNTFERAQACASKFDLEIPVGHDPGDDGRRSNLLRDYRTGGTPWFILIDKNGVVVENDFHRPAAELIESIEALLSAEPLVGSRLGPELADLGAVRPASSELAFEFEDSELTLLRWWTDGCPHCAASLPALDRLARETDGLRCVGVYHPKPPHDEDGSERDLASIRDSAGELGFEGPLLVDWDWSLLRALQSRGLPTRATSVSVLVDREGVIRWFHQGPRLHGAQAPETRDSGDGGAAETDSSRSRPAPSDEHPEAAQDFQELREVVSRLLADRETRKDG